MKSGNPGLSVAVMQQAVDAVAEHGCVEYASRALNIPDSTFRHRYKKAIAAGFSPGGTVAKPAREFEYPKMPDPEMSPDELVEHRIKQFDKKKRFEDARRLIQVKVKVDGPIGVWHFGDPHVDDDGTDLGAIREHTRIVRETPGLFGANVGDTTNNWIGRLARLYGQQETSESQAWTLAEWFLRRVDWLYLIGGNHDAWSGTGDPIKWIQRGRSAPYMSSEVRLELQFPNKNTCRINARHDFSGHSQYNPAHGPMKATMFGVRDHIAIAGHKHISGHGVVKDPDTGATCHSFLVASYKIYDRFAREKGFRDQHISPGVFTLIDPRLPNTHPDFVTHFWSIERGVDYLNYLRKGG
jgi:hypothetical protein